MSQGPPLPLGMRQCSVCISTYLDMYIRPDLRYFPLPFPLGISLFFLFDYLGTYMKINNIQRPLFHSKPTCAFTQCISAL